MYIWRVYEWRSGNPSTTGLGITEGAQADQLFSCSLFFLVSVEVVSFIDPENLFA